MLKPFWKKHFTLQNFYPFHENPTTFIACQWQKNKDQPNLKYLTYRTAAALLFLVTWFISLTEKPTAEKWPIFLTNWGYTICTLQAVLAVLLLSFSSLAPQMKTMPNLRRNVLKGYPVYWILNTIATPVAFGITLMYWIVVYDPKTMTFDAMNYFVHGNNSVLMLLDLWMVAHPVRLFHFIYPIIVGLAYTIFSLIYYLAGGLSRDGSRCIYKVLNWDVPVRTTFICLGVILLIIVLHICAFINYKFKLYIHDKCFVKKDIPPKSEFKDHAVYDNKAMTTDVV